MPVKAAMWVHGNDVQAEYVGPWLNIARRGWGTHFKTAGSKNWFHIPFTTPVILENIRPKLAKIIIYYKTVGDAKIEAVHIYDSEDDVKKFDNLTLQGNHSGVVDSQNSWILNPPLTINFGLGLSVKVSFGKTNNNIVPEIMFYSAGADFVTP